MSEQTRRAGPACLRAPPSRTAASNPAASARPRARSEPLSLREPLGSSSRNGAGGGRAAGNAGGEGEAPPRRLGPPPGTGTGRARLGRGRRWRCGCGGEGCLPSTRTHAPRPSAARLAAARQGPERPRTGIWERELAPTAFASASCSACTVVWDCFSEVWLGRAASAPRRRLRHLQPVLPSSARFPWGGGMRGEG